MKIYKKKKVKGVNASAMKDGDICKILTWIVKMNEGLICQRSGYDLIILGSSDLFSGYFSKPKANENRVKILPKGTLLII